MAREPAFITVFIDGQAFEASPGETVAALLVAAGRRAWRRSRSGAPRGLLCGMGVCFDCLVMVDDAPGIRACQTVVRDGMRVVTNYTESTSYSGGKQA